MAIATSAALTAASLAATAGTTAMSFTQAARQRKLQDKAQADAAKYMAEAEKALEVNFYDQLGIMKEPYELEREALLSSGAQAIEAGVESERGAAAAAGRVQMAQQQGQRQIAAAMGQEMLGLEKLAAQEDARMRDMGVSLDLAQVEGAQKAAANADMLEARAMQQGMQGIASLASQAVSQIPLYQKTASVKELERMAATAQKAGVDQKAFQTQLETIGAMDPQFSNLAGVGAMDPMKFQAFMSSLPADYLKKVNQQFQTLLPAQQTIQSLIGGGSMFTGPF